MLSTDDCAREAMRTSGQTDSFNLTLDNQPFRTAVPSTASLLRIDWSLRNCLHPCSAGHRGGHRDRAPPAPLSSSDILGTAIGAEHSQRDDGGADSSQHPHLFMRAWE